MTQHLFILGAQDPEMREIARLIKEYGHDVSFAANTAQRCSSGTAYSADAVIDIDQHNRVQQKLVLAHMPCVFVECAVTGFAPVFTVDHHNPGDPGFDKLPPDYLQGASLGQVMSWLGHTPNETQRLLCAADHCLSAAYLGQCPEVDPGELLYLRASWQGLMSKRSTGVVIDSILSAAKHVRARYLADKGYSFFDDPTRIPADLPEAAAYTGLPIRYRSYSPVGDLKEMIKGAGPAAIAAFMAEHEAAGRRTYGNPYRGYAGAYLYNKPHG